jgi:hypothetical protein
VSTVSFVHQIVIKQIISSSSFMNKSSTEACIIQRVVFTEVFQESLQAPRKLFTSIASQLFAHRFDSQLS